MSITYTCDWCGDAIESGDTSATLDVCGSAPSDGSNQYVKTERISGWLGHYHTSNERPCWWKVREAFDLLHEYGPTLETIPTLTGQAVAARRRKHTRPTQENDE